MKTPCPWIDGRTGPTRGDTGVTKGLSVCHFGCRWLGWHISRPQVSGRRPSIRQCPKSAGPVGTTSPGSRSPRAAPNAALPAQGRFTARSLASREESSQIGGASPASRTTTRTFFRPSKIPFGSVVLRSARRTPWEMTAKTATTRAITTAGISRIRKRVRPTTTRTRASRLARKRAAGEAGRWEKEKTRVRTSPKPVRSVLTEKFGIPNSTETGTGAFGGQDTPLLFSPSLEPPLPVKTGRGWAGDGGQAGATV